MNAVIPTREFYRVAFYIQHKIFTLENGEIKNKKGPMIAVNGPPVEWASADLDDVMKALYSGLEKSWFMGDSAWFNNFKKALAVFENAAILLPTPKFFEGDKSWLKLSMITPSTTPPDMRPPTFDPVVIRRVGIVILQQYADTPPDFTNYSGMIVKSKWPAWGDLPIQAESELALQAIRKSGEPKIDVEFHGIMTQPIFNFTTSAGLRGGASTGGSNTPKYSLFPLNYRVGPLVSPAPNTAPSGSPAKNTP